ncbi:response regulator transcription factor [Hazenella sp. IB182357]|uniref:Response regulator transcription factor n=1 Tax=Polycladospora coralii TaxID=2771432 RepID=A0A926NCM8_9BACL|nr:response regulator transcription factor [Polycladospora coralii]MBD1370983.1 response regulator transcription factor [Polycladospora coralii]MBS7529922.1 response regulator transcription factor [Polycladospora coralii]
MPDSILIIEDNQKLRTIICDYFLHANFEVFEAMDDKQAFHILEKHAIDLIILDIMLPKMSGWDILEIIRKKSNIPVIILTALSTDEDHLKGYDLKADDYVTKPFRPAILVAKAKVLIERVKADYIQPTHQLIAGNIRVNLQTHEVWVKDKPLILTKKEYELLLYLIKNPGRVLTRENILNHIWGINFIGNERVVDTHIKKLRNHLADESFHIKTVFGFGYQFEKDC